MKTYDISITTNVGIKEIEIEAEKFILIDGFFYFYKEEAAIGVINAAKVISIFEKE